MEWTTPLLSAEGERNLKRGVRSRQHPSKGWWETDGTSEHRGNAEFLLDVSEIDVEVNEGSGLVWQQAGKRA
jgi:hypothetical protein